MDQTGPVSEVVVDRRGREAASRRHASDREAVNASFEKQPLGGFEDRLAGGGTPRWNAPTLEGGRGVHALQHRLVYNTVIPEAFENFTRLLSGALELPVPTGVYSVPSNPEEVTLAELEARPPVWVGHVTLAATNVAQTADWLAELGLRMIERGAVAVLELRGGTHLVVLPADRPPERGAPAPFDLMFEDLDAVWRRCQELGFEPSPIEDQSFHRSFTLLEPGGQRITVNSSHASGHPV